MKKLALTGVIAAAALGVAACNGADEADTDNVAAADESTETVDTSADSAGATGTGSADWEGARIVEENGTFYRVDRSGERVALGPDDSRIVVEDNVRYRVDPDGTRVRIDDDGLGVDVDLPDVDVGVNEKGNLDVDVGDRDPDGGR